MMNLGTNKTAGSNLASYFEPEKSKLILEDGSRIGVIGGGPAGTFFAYFLFKMAESLGLQLHIDIYEPRFFNHTGPAGCNHCGGIVSESMVQLLATEGINLPPSVVQRGIDSYTLHMDVGDVRIQTPHYEKRIAAVFRGNGPRESPVTDNIGFDRYLLDLASSSGANVIRKMVNQVEWIDDKPQLITPDDTKKIYDFIAVTTGINSQALQMFSKAAPDYKSPQTLRTFIGEFRLGREAIEEHLGTSMHVFLLDIPRLEFAALIPKGEYATLCILGDDVDNELVDIFINTPEVKRCFPGSIVPTPACHCFPHVNIETASQPYNDRIVWIGDCGTARLYKDGIGSAYRMAKAAARTAVFYGISAEDFKQYYWTACNKINFDNMIAKVIFTVTRLIQKGRFLRRGVLRMTTNEQLKDGRRDMSSALWDVFTGSAPYKEVLLRCFYPNFPIMLFWNLIVGNLPFTKTVDWRKNYMKESNLGKSYRDGEVVVQQGEPGNCMYAIQEGELGVFKEHEGRPTIRVAVLKTGDIFGEMAIFEQEIRSATVKAMGEARVLTVDKKTFLRRVQEDPTLAFNLVRMMSQRIRSLNAEIGERRMHDRRMAKERRTMEDRRGRKESK